MKILLFWDDSPVLIIQKWEENQLILHLKTEHIENKARDLIRSPSFSYNLLFDNEFSHDLSISIFSHAKLRVNNLLPTDYEDKEKSQVESFRL